MPIEIAAPFQCGFTPARYKVWYGGRASMKSWNIARLLLHIAARKETRILCTREYQTSIKDSVHRLLADQISLLKWDNRFNIQNNSITSACGAEFIFKGLQRNINEIKSTEGIDICWVEEAQPVSDNSWKVLIPTIRKEGSEIWISFNPDEATDPTYQRFVINPPPGAIVKKVGFEDNPWLPATMEAERLYCQATDPDAYRNIWEGETRVRSAAEVFGGKWRIAAFEAPPDTRFYFGADWGFSQDPTTLIRSYIMDRTLYIDYEAWGIGVEIDEIHALFRSVPGADKWQIKADSARPETISAVRRSGFNIVAARKWTGSIEDGVAYLRGFKEIIIHQRCKHLIDEMKQYRYKTDKLTGEVLPVIVDKYNHGIDALRYAHSDTITASIPDYSQGGISKRFAT